MREMSKYEIFRDYVMGLRPDELPRDEEFPATSEEVGFWKHYQFSRAVVHARVGGAALAELNYLRRHHLFHSQKRYIETKKKELS